jgi:hypothetical protein
MSATAFPCIHQESTTADVVAYVGLKLQHLDFVEELKRFIEGHDIDGMQFLSLDLNALFLYGLRPGEETESLLKLIRAVVQ